MKKSDSAKPSFHLPGAKKAAAEATLYEQLEERVLFDAAPTAPVDPDNAESDGLDQANAERFDASAQAEDVKTVSDTRQTSQEENEVAPYVRQELVIVDTSVENYQQLVDDLLQEDDPTRDFQVVTIDGDQDGVEQISGILSRYSQLDALHIVSHGDDYGVNLGNVWLSRDNLGGYASSIAQWGNALTSNGDILFLGCHLAATADGQDLLQSISTLTGADVAASTDDTGYAPRGGDWDLEYILGETETSVAFSEQLQQEWTGLLAVGPSIAISPGDATPQIGDDVTFSVIFDNTAPAGSGDTGYAPFVDLIFPVNGADGAAGADTADGLDFVDATYLGNSIDAFEFIFPDDDGNTDDRGTVDPSDDLNTGTFGTILHPFATAVQSELQRVTFYGAADGGTLTVEFDGESTAIDLSAASGVLDAATLQAALESLSNIDAGDITVTGGDLPGADLFVEFAGQYAETDVAALTFDNSQLEMDGDTANPHGSFAAHTLVDGSDAAQALRVYGTSVNSESQRLTLDGDITGGSFTLSFDGQTTAAINLDGSGGVITAAQIQTSLETLSNIEAGDVIVTGGPAGGGGGNSPLFISFAGQYARSNVAQITADGAGLTNSSGPAGTLATRTLVSGTFSDADPRNYVTAGDKLVVLELPFGSFTPEQPEVEILVNASMSELADLHSASNPESDLIVKARSGFRHGADALDNPEEDPSILSDNQVYAANWAAEAVVQPQLLEISTDVIAPENETATGPNYPRQFVTRVDIPDGQTIRDFDLTNLLPDNVVFLQLDSIESADGDVVFTTNVPAGVNSLGDPTNNSGYNGANAYTPLDVSGPRDGQSLIITADEVTGASGNNDFVVTWTGYVTEVAADSAGDPSGPVIPVNGEDDAAGSSSVFTATASGDWQAEDARDAGASSSDNANAGPSSSTLDDKAIAIQKSASIVGGGDTASVGDIIEYTLSFQISDYFTFGNLVITDVFTDGQRFYDTVDIGAGLDYRPVFTVSDANGSYVDELFNVHVGAENSVTTEAAEDNFIVDQSDINNADNGDEVGDGTLIGGGADTTTGATTITIDLSERLQQLGDDGILQGGHTFDGDANDNNLGSATGTVTFYVQVQDEYSDDFASGDRSVDHDDRLSNNVDIAGTVRENEEDGDINNSTGVTESDNSAARIDIAGGVITKDVYAINGDTNLPAQLRLSPGDELTYRITYTLPTSDFENLTITDFLPLPALVADDFDGDDFGGDAWTFNLAGSFDAVAPDAGVVEFGENDTFFNSNAANGSDYFDASNIIVDATANSLQFDFGTYDDPTNQESLIELLFTVTLQDDAFADGLFLTNIARAASGSTNQTPDPADALVQVSLGQPDLSITKGIVATSNATAAVDPAGPVVNDEYQTLTFGGGNVGGTFRLTFDGEQTAVIGLGSTAAQIQSALESLSSIGAGNVKVYGGRLVDEPLTVQFTGDLAGSNQDALVSDAVEVTVGAGLEGGEAISIGGIGDATPFTGRITSGALADQAIDLNVTDPVNAGDTVRFMIIVENSGEGANGAFDVQVRDQLPPEYEYVAGSLTAVDGNGDTLTFTGSGGHPAHDLFGNGITLDDPGATGAVGGGVDGGSLDAFSPFDGRNIAVITYEAKLVDEAAFSNDDITRGETIENVAVLVNYAGAEGAEDHTASINESQQLTATGTPSSGSYTLTFEGETTAAIAWDATEAEVQAALQALATIGDGNVRVTGEDLSDGSLNIRFLRDLGDTNVSQITVDDSSLGGATLAASTVVEGSLNEIQQLAASGDVTSGVFTLTFEGEETAPIAYDADAATIKAALEALNSIPAGSVNVAGDGIPSSPTVIEFTGALGAQNVSQLIVDSTGLVGGGSYSSSTSRSGMAQDPRDGATVNIGAEASLEKSIIATSEAHTGNDTDGNPLAAIGEIVRYRIAVELPGGTLENLKILDNLPDGLTYIDDGTATIAFVSDTGGGVVSSTLTAGALPDSAVSSDEDGNLDDYTSGLDVWFKAGDVTNTEVDDGNAEFVIIEFNALVTNDSDSSAGSVKRNDAQIWTGAGDDATEIFDLADEDRPVLTVVEPNITGLTKTVNNAGNITADAGDEVTFSVAFQNGNGDSDADAFDVQLIDNLPDDFTLTGLELYINGVLQTAGSDYTDNTSGGNINLTINRVGKNASVEILYTATVDSTAQPSEVLENQAFLTWTSLPGDTGTENGAGGNNTGSDLASIAQLSTASGENYGERNGNNEGQNVYLADDSATVTIETIRFEKEFTGTSVNDTAGSGVNGDSEAVVGELVQYKFTVTVPEGTTNAAEIFDTLDAGLEFVSVDTITSSAGLSSSIAGVLSDTAVVEANMTAMDQTLLFSLGDITNSNNTAAEETIEITYSVRVENITAIQSTAQESGPSLNNVAHFRWNVGGDAQQTEDSSAAEVTIIEPRVHLDKSVVAVDQDAGNPIAYTITIKHNDASLDGLDSEADAFDLTFFDNLPDGIDFVSFAVVHSNVAESVNFTDKFEYDAANHRVQTKDNVSFDLLVGDEVTIGIAGTVASDVGPGQLISNRGDINWTSLDDDQPGERNGDDGRDGELNNYATYDVATFTTALPEVAKELVSTSIDNSGDTGTNSGTEAVIGETAVYRITLTIPEGETQSSKIVDSMELGLQFVEIVSVTTAGGVTHDPVTTSTTGDGVTMAQTVTFDFGLIDSNDTDDSDPEQIFLEYRAVVTNAATSGTGSGEDSSLVNDAEFQWDLGGAQGQQTQEAPSSPTITVIEPDLDIVKNVVVDGSGTGGDAGDSVVYTIDIDHAATSTDAFDLTFSDAVSSKITYDISGVSVIITHADDSTTDITSQFEVVGNVLRTKTAGPASFDLLEGETVQVIIAGQLNSTVISNETISNTATVTWTSLNDDEISGSATSNERDGEGAPDDYTETSADGGGNDATIEITSSVFEKSLFNTNETETTGSDVTIGETVTYALLVQLGEGETPGLTIVDQLPDGLAFTGFRIETTAAGSADYLGTQLLSADFNGSFAGAPTVTSDGGSGDDVTFDFGAITVNADNVENNNSFLLLVDAVVADVASNVGYGGSATTLQNIATLDVSGDGVAAQNSGAVDVEVVEPNLSITKEFGATVDTDKADAGETLTIRLTVSNTGDGAAYNVNVQDILNAAHYDTDSVAFVTTPGGFTAANASGAVTYSGGTIAAGGTVTFEFQATLLNTVTPAAVLTNTATIEDGSTLEGNVAGERNTPDADGDGSDSNSDTVTIRSNSFAGTVFQDVNNDGVINGADAGIGGVTINLDGFDNFGNEVHLVTTTSSDAGSLGEYLFDGLRAGDYTITEVQPATHLDGIDTLGSQGGTAGADQFTVSYATGTETNGTGNNFAELLPADLSGFVYHDASNDGVKDAAETGIEGAFVRLTGTNDKGAITPQIFETLADGSYSFSLLRPGTYKVEQVAQPTGFLDGKDSDGSLANGDASANDEISSIEITSGQSASAYNFGEVIASTVSGYVYHDSDNDGDFADEPAGSGISGVTITLTGKDDLGADVNATTTTNASGFWEFAGLRPSDGSGYTITEGATPAPFIDGKDSIGSQSGTAANDSFTSVIVSDTDGTGNNFGELRPARLSGAVFNDHNNDGEFDTGDGETGIQGVTIRLTGTDDLGNTVNVAVVTGADGTYEFTGLRPSNAAGYTITETHPVAYTDGTDSDGSLANGDTTTDDTITSINVASDDNGTGYNFAERGASITGTVFVDDNRDGDLDTGENARVEGVTVELFDMADPLNPVSLGTTTTGNDGTYSFDNLPAGDYRIVQTQPTQYGNTSSNTVDLTMPLAGSTGVDFGEALFDIGDVIYFDADNSGGQNGTEQGIGGVQVTLQYAGANGVFGDGDDPADIVTTTGADGAYSFTEQFNGNYRIVVDQLDLPTGMTGTQETDDAAAAIDGTSFITVADADRLDVDFGYTGSLSTGDAFFYDIDGSGGRNQFDSDGDGVADTTEPGIAGVTVNLVFAGADGDFSTTSDNLTLSATTTATGAYSFDNLPEGEYRISYDGATIPSGSTQTVETDDTSAAVDGTSNITLDANRTDVDFGFTGDYSLGDSVWFDYNGDGVRGLYDADGNSVAETLEPGLGDVEVTLLSAGQNGVFGDADDYQLVTVTDAGGAFSFAGLPDGDYRISVTSADVPAGSSLTFDRDDAAFGPAALDETANVRIDGASRTDVDFGYTGSGEIGDLVWFDVDGDGILDAGEPGLADITVDLLFFGEDGLQGTDDDFTLSTVTSSTGAYAFDNLPDGGYIITVDTDDPDLPSGLTGVTGAGSFPGTASVTLAGGNENDSIDFGFTGVRTLGDTVYFDYNSNGQQDQFDSDGNGVADTLEPGLGDVEVTLVYAGQNGVFGDSDDVTLTTTTSSDGDYQFTNLPDGDYRVSVTGGDVPDGVTQTEDQDDAAFGAAALDNTANLRIDDSNRTDVDFGYSGSGAISDFVWLDVDGDGVQDAGEPGLADVTVDLLFFGEDGVQGTDDDFTLSTVTSSAGAYEFDNLPEGVFEVTVDTTDTDLPSGLTGVAGAESHNVSAQLTLLEGVENDTVDFGFTGVRTLGNTVYFDFNNSGSQDQYDADGDGAADTLEPGIREVTVTLVSAGQDGDFATTADNFEVETITGADGAYLFTNLPDLDYRIVVDTGDLPTGFVQTEDTDDAVFASTALDHTSRIRVDGANRPDADFGYRGQRSIGDRLWHDANADGLQTAGEPGIAGVAITALFAGENGEFGDADDITVITVTADDGTYTFDNLFEGDYRISYAAADLPSGMTVNTFDVDGTEDGTANVTLGATSRTDVDFGFAGVRTIGDTVWFDVDGDGVQDGVNEPGLGNVQVNLLFAGPDGIFGTADDTSLSTVTSDTGVYEFENLPDGKFRISVDTGDLPAGMVQTYEADGSTNNQAEVTISGVDAGNVDFGFRGAGEISDRVWHDTDGDGVQDASNEPGIANVRVDLDFAGKDNTFGTDDDFSLFTITNASGGYSFESLPAGDYRVDVDESTLPGSNSQTFEQDDDTNNIAGTAEVSLTNGQLRDDVDFGYTGSLTVGDRIFFDADGDGVADDGAGADPFEPGLKGVDVRLVYAGEDGDFATVADNIELTTTTGDDGAYQFERLFDGDYRIVVDTATLPGAAVQTSDRDDAAYGAAALDHTANIELSSSSRTDADFGYRGSRVIGDTIFFDVNNNSAQDANDRGLPGIDVTAAIDIDGDGATDYSITTTTDIDGNYSFERLIAGTYTITVDSSDLPEGTAANPATDPDGDPGSPHAATVVVAADADRNDIDFGYRGNAIAGDRVWLDTDGDGVQDANNEPGLANVEVTLIWFGPDGVLDAAAGGDDEVFTQVTTDDGAYLFEFLPGGNYQISVDAADAPGNTALTTGNNPTSFTLAAGENNRNLDFGFQGGATGGGTIGEFVFYDFDNDGIFNNEDVAYPGVDITITADIDGDGDVETFTTTTNENGLYEVAGLPYADYTVTLSPPTGTSPSVDATGLADNQSTVTLNAGNQSSDTQTFGLTGTGTVADSVFFDENGDGEQNNGEAGIPGVVVTIEVDLDDDGVADFTTTATTGQTGGYTFPNIPAGQVTLTVALPPGTEPTTVHAGETESSNTTTFNLGDGETSSGQQFGLSGTGSIASTVFFDADGDEIQDDGAGADPAEPGLPGVSVFLDIDFNGDGVIDRTLETTTGDDGSYSFDNLPAGDYTVRVAQPAGTSQTTDANGALDNASSLTLAAGENNTSQVFGYTGTGTITDTVFFDIDGDAVHDAAPEDRGIAGVDVTLSIDVNGDNIADYVTSVVSDANGDFTFTNLIPGTYTLTTDPDDMRLGLATNPSVDNDGIDTPHSASYALAAGATADGTGFGFHATPDYEITKSSDTATAEPGDTIRYTIRVRNIGELDGRNVTITDNFPADILNVTSATGGTIDNTNGVITWDLAAMNPDEEVILLVTAEVLSPALAGNDDITNTVSVTDDGYNGADSDTTNNQSQVTTTLDAAPDYVVTVTDNLEEAEPGDNVTYSIVVTNQGNQNGTGVVVTSQLQPGLLKGVSANAGGVYNSATGIVTWELGDQDAGEMVVLTINATIVNPLPPGFDEAVNIVSATDDGANGADPTPGNNSATDITALPVFGFDSFTDPSGGNKNLSVFDRIDVYPGDNLYKNRLQPLPVDTVYTGVVDPGTTLSGKIYDEYGRMIGEQIVVADAAGNWLMQFPTVVLFEQPHEMRVDQTLAVHNSGLNAGFNMRRFFHPAIHSQLYMNEPLSVDAAFRHDPFSVLTAMHQANNNPLGFGWEHHAYELVVSSSNTSAM